MRKLGGNESLMIEFTCNTKGFLRVIMDERRLLEILLVLKFKKRQNEFLHVTTVKISAVLILFHLCAS